jgi:hypothetical protein
LLWIGALRELLFEKGIVSEKEFIDRYKKLNREFQAKRGKS